MFEDSMGARVRSDNRFATKGGAAGTNGGYI